MRAHVRWGLLIIIGSGCGLGVDLHPTEGPGQLVGSSSPLDGGVGVPLIVPFDVELLCTQNGPMQDLKSATGRLRSPEGGVSVLRATWSTTPRETYDCTETEWQRLSHVTLTVTPDAPGTWNVEVTLEPKVGTFARDVLVHP